MHPASKGGGQELKSGSKKNKNFPLSLATSKLLLTFALPIEKKGKTKQEKQAGNGRTITPTGHGTRSLNVWKRQVVRASGSNVGSSNYKRNTKT
ncbi:hypothetical protein ACFST9_12605, partial [Hymenobacter monticola]|uniref:Uncharacterized protein n=1 Tax=Hymenobacter monticola TaxID=1705399 RepID=A0ABY4B720_9BACT|nr:hypothetical protein [Hymenobacter monticola]UOE34972.1 hypothetical protein MTP16_04805 [Hymenobacter monticola]